MSERKRGEFGPEDVRELFRNAASEASDGTDRLLARVPAAFAEVRRRRAPAPTVADALVPLARRWLPAVATATLVLAGIALVAGPAEKTAATEPDAGVDRLVLIGELGENGTDDVLLRAIVGDDDGTEVER